MAIMGIISHIVFDDQHSSNLGHLRMAGIVHDSPGVLPTRPMRVYGHYALVYITAGAGYFEDDLGYRCPVKTGNMIFVFPDIGHAYGPTNGTCWDESFLVFDGPIFDQWRQDDWLNPKKPVITLKPLDYWFKRLRDTAWSMPQSSQAHALSRLCYLQQLLADIFLNDQQHNRQQIDEVWLTEASTLLESNLGETIDYQAVAKQLGMSYDGFRKRFTKNTGLSPAKYRIHHRIDQASKLLVNEKLTLKEIAYRLGFSDQYHLSKQFKQITGMTPRDFRKLFPFK